MNEMAWWSATVVVHGEKQVVCVEMAPGHYQVCFGLKAQEGGGRVSGRKAPDIARSDGMRFTFRKEHPIGCFRTNRHENKAG
jgi:hypothetical protein